MSGKGSSVVRSDMVDVNCGFPLVAWQLADINVRTYCQIDGGCETVFQFFQSWAKAAIQIFQAVPASHETGSPDALAIFEVGTSKVWRPKCGLQEISCPNVAMSSDIARNGGQVRTRFLGRPLPTF